MTTIIFYEDKLYADTQVSIMSVLDKEEIDKTFKAQKIFQVDNYIFSISGSYRLFSMVCEKIKTLMRYTGTFCKGTGTSNMSASMIIYNTEKKKVSWVRLKSKKLLGNYYFCWISHMETFSDTDGLLLAIGSGKEYVDTFYMFLRKKKWDFNPITAIRYASKRDKYTNKKIQIVDLKTEMSSFTNSNGEVSCRI